MQYAYKMNLKFHYGPGPRGHIIAFSPHRVRHTIYILLWYIHIPAVPFKYDKCPRTLLQNCCRTDVQNCCYTSLVFRLSSAAPYIVYTSICVLYIYKSKPSDHCRLLQYNTAQRCRRRVFFFLRVTNYTRDVAMQHRL